MLNHGCLVGYARQIVEIVFILRKLLSINNKEAHLSKFFYRKMARMSK